MNGIEIAGRYYRDEVAPQLWDRRHAAALLGAGSEVLGYDDDLGSRVLGARLVRELMRLAFLVERRWAPYGKWFGRAFGELESAAELKPLLDGALGAPGWRERERMVAGAATVLARRTNGLMLAGPVDPAPRQFYERDITVLGAERFTVALAEEITDPVLRGLVDRLGLRHGHIPRLPGTVDQAVDSTDALAIPERFRKAAPLLGIDLHVVGREAV